MEDLKPLIMQVFAPKKGERVIILNDFPEDDLEIDDDFIARRYFARKWHMDISVLAKKAGFSVEEIITYEPTKANNKPLPEKAFQSGKEIDLKKKLNSLNKKDIVIAITRYSATAPLKELMEKHGFRGASMPGVNEDMAAFEADYSLVAKKAKTLAGKLSKAVSADAEFSTGHKIHFDLRAARDAETDDGNYTKPGILGNLPAGEAYICPYEGFSKKLGESQTKGDIPAIHEDEKVVFRVERGMIREIEGIGPKAGELREFIEKDTGRRYIAELGLGCNEKAEFCNEIIQDEKIEGMHFAFGYNGHFGGAITKDKFASEENIVHQDYIYSIDAQIHVKKLDFTYKGNKKEIILEEGKYREDLF
jgi:leucyl aminopeptidase (aminopeptidase T)